MTLYLLDVNVLIALFWPAHEFHDAAQAWYGSLRTARWATCPLTQSGFIRITSNPRFSRDAISPQEASRRLAANLANPRHRFLPDAIPYAEAIAPIARRIVGHQHVTDAYLLGLALHHRAKLATFDTRLRALAEENARVRSALAVLAT